MKAFVEDDASARPGQVRSAALRDGLRDSRQPMKAEALQTGKGSGQHRLKTEYSYRHCQLILRSGVTEHFSQAQVSSGPALRSEMDFNTTISEHQSDGTRSSSCILWQSEAKDITLVDIPRSIAAAQGSSQSPCNDSLLSCRPLDTPFTSNEPKSEAAKAKLKARMETEHDARYSALVSNALSSINTTYHGEWCLPRVLDPQAPVQGRKRKASEMRDETLRNSPASVDPDIATEYQHPKHGAKLPDLPSNLLEELSTSDACLRRDYTLRWVSPNRGDNGLEGAVREASGSPETDTILWHQYLSNTTSAPQELQVSTLEAGSFHFRIPPHAAFFLGDCSEANAFHVAVRNTAQREDTARQFDFIVMDPPWPNASVRRTHTTGKGTYKVSESIWDIRQLIFEMDIDVLLSKGGLIAIWITNKPAVRDLVLGEGGFFDCWDVVLEEEWLWIKTTDKGEPVTSLDALWRRPYEVLLLGRKCQSHTDKSEVDQVEPEAKLRVIAGVPDLHSRKPCLRELLEKLAPNTTKYRALEIFARYLVAGWWSWGNEAIKFNHEHCWDSS